MIKYFRRNLLLLLLATTVACSKNDNEPTPVPPDPKPQTEHTVVLYMPGRSLLSFYRQNIANLRAAIDRGEMGSGRLIVCYQPDNQTTARLCEISYSDEAEGSVMEEIERFDFNASSAEDVAMMLQKAVETAPTDSYGLIIGTHGSAWIPVASGQLQSLQPSAATGVSDDIWQPVEGALKTRAFGDRGYDIDITAFSEILSSLDVRFDYIVFDACFMANIETLYDLRHNTDYIVSSPCEIMAAGFPYDRMVTHLYDTARPVRERMVSICSEFYNFYQYDWNSYPGNEQSGCISLCSTAELDALADVVRRLNATPQNDYDILKLQDFEGLFTPVFYDFGQYYRRAYSDAALLEEFNRTLDAAFPPSARLNTEQFYSAYNNRMNPIAEDGYSGVTTSAPSAKYAEEQTQTSWYKATH